MRKVQMRGCPDEMGPDGGGGGGGGGEYMTWVQMRVVQVRVCPDERGSDERRSRGQGFLVRVVPGKRDSW